MLAEAGPATSTNEPHDGGASSQLNWPHAGTLGTDDGIISVGFILEASPQSTRGLPSGPLTILAV
jgi:hypothetical protein